MRGFRMIKDKFMEVSMPYGQVKRIYTEKGDAGLLEVFQNIFQGLKVYSFSKEWLTNNRKYLIVTGEKGKVIIKW
jgi:hypothetical protein